jgi:signal transduction histidine kinase
MRLDMCCQELVPLLQQSIQGNQAYANQYEVELALTYTDASLAVNVDTERFAQIMANLLSNAIKFSPRGRRVDIVATGFDQSVEISVVDQGPGIPAEFHGRIFQKFAQADSSDTRAKGGTGLGLAITRELAERMNGKVGFNSVHGQGARFYVQLPAVELSARG